MNKMAKQQTPKNFYEGTAKEAHPPRIVYRELTEAILEAEGPSERRGVVDQFLQRVEAEHSRGEFLKLRLTPPQTLKHILEDGDWERIESQLVALQAKRRNRVFSVYPTCADEYQFDHSFYHSIFKAQPEPLFNKTSKIFGIGSCFAVNISRHLRSLGYNTSHYAFAEHINSVFGNHLLFSLIHQSPEYRADFIKTVAHKFAKQDRFDDSKVTSELNKLEFLRDQISNSKVIIVSLGNTVDAFFSEKVTNIEPYYVFPRFISGFDGFTVENQSKVTSVIKKLGGQFRLGRIGEVLPTVMGMMRSLRLLNPNADIFVTVSPVSIHNIMGIEEFATRGPVEADCASKTILRTCVEEVLATMPDDKIRYFPSFEIVRWLGGHSDIQAFGQDDGSAMHVSSEILTSIFSYFEYLYAESEQ